MWCSDMKSTSKKKVSWKGRSQRNCCSNLFAVGYACYFLLRYQSKLSCYFRCYNATTWKHSTLVKYIYFPCGDCENRSSFLVHIVEKSTVIEPSFSILMQVELSATSLLEAASFCRLDANFHWQTCVVSSKSRVWMNNIELYIWLYMGGEELAFNWKLTEFDCCMWFMQIRRYSMFFNS